MPSRPSKEVVIQLPDGIPRCQVRAICARIHDLDSVVSVEIDPRERWITVTGAAELDAVSAAAGLDGKAGF